MAVADELSRLSVRTGETEADENVVQTAFQLDEKVLAGHAFLADGAFKISAELVFKNAVDALDLLLLAQLQTVTDDLSLASLTVLSRRKVSLFDGARRLEAALPFEEQLHAFSA